MSANNRTRHPFARFLRWFGTMMGVYFLLAAILSLTVDPWRINNTPLSIDSLDSAREISGTVRVGKAALANRGNWEAVIIGSSIMEIAMDPTHPAFGGKRTVNLAMAAAGVLETIPAGNYIMDRNPGIDTMVLGIDAGDLHNDFDSRKYDRFYESPFADNNISVERAIGQLIGGRSLADSIATLRRHFNGESPRRSPLGQWLQPNHPPDLRAYVEAAFKMGFITVGDEWALKPQELNREKADLLLRYISRVRDAGIRMHIVITPHHALRQIHPVLNEPGKSCWQHHMLALIDICNKANSVPSQGPPVTLWNFMTFNTHSTTPLPAPTASSRQMPGWFDLGHAQPELGDRMIETMLAGKPPVDQHGNPYGVNLLESDWETVRRGWIAGHLAYCTEHPEDVSWWRSRLAESEKNKNAPSPPSRDAD